jgi:hypothetical protein
MRKNIRTPGRLKDTPSANQTLKRRGEKIEN